MLSGHLIGRSAAFRLFIHPSLAESHTAAHLGPSKICLLTNAQRVALKKGFSQRNTWRFVKKNLINIHESVRQFVRFRIAQTNSIESY